LVELTVLLTAARKQTTQVLKEAAAVYKVDTDIAAKVKQEFAAKDKAKVAKKAEPKPPAKQRAKTAEKSAAA
jgi:ParB family chromosome partitioning protein